MFFFEKKCFSVLIFIEEDFLDEEEFFISF